MTMKAMIRRLGAATLIGTAIAGSTAAQAQADVESAASGALAANTDRTRSAFAPRLCTR